MEQYLQLDSGLCLKFDHPGFELWCSLGESSKISLSFDEARALLASIASACERSEIDKVKFGRLSWTTDARLNPKHPDRVTVKFNGALGLGHVGLSRRRLLSACREFSSRYGTSVEDVSPKAG